MESLIKGGKKREVAHTYLISAECLDIVHILINSPWSPSGQVQLSSPILCVMKLQPRERKKLARFSQMANGRAEIFLGAGGRARAHVRAGQRG